MWPRDAKRLDTPVRENDFESRILYLAKLSIKCQGDINCFHKCKAKKVCASVYRSCTARIMGSTIDMGATFEPKIHNTLLSQRLSVAEMLKQTCFWEAGNAPMSLPSLSFD